MKFKKNIILSFVTLLGLIHVGFGETSAPSPNYVLQPSDIVRLQIYQEPDLETQFRVPQDGEYHFPLIGPVNIQGLTIREVENLLRELYDRDYLVRPQLNLLILEYAQRRVNVIGSVNQPGTVVFPPEESMTIVDAISRAGGVSRLGRSNNVVLTRTGPDGKVETITVNIDDIIQGRSPNIPLQKDDFIFVPERRI